MSDTQFTFLGQPGSCSDWTQGIPIARNTTSSRVCGISYTSNNDTFLLRPCCSSDVEIYACASYCASNMSISDFAGCVLNARGNSTTAPLDGDNIFCQGNITPSEKQSLAATSSAMPATRAPRFSVWLAVLLGFMLFSPSLASVIPPLDDLAGSVARRATSCDFTIDSKYSKLGATIGPLSGYSSGSRVEATGNNRTVNGSSAASAEYDGFFGVLANLTGRRYPAVTGVSLDFEWYNSGDAATYLAFTPYLFCVNGTATDCGAALDDGESNFVEACGPVFASDWVAEGQTEVASEADSTTVQGILQPVVTSLPCALCD